MNISLSSSSSNDSAARPINVFRRSENDNAQRPNQEGDNRQAGQPDINNHPHDANNLRNNNPRRRNRELFENNIHDVEQRPQQRARNIPNPIELPLQEIFLVNQHENLQDPLQRHIVELPFNNRLDNLADILDAALNINPDPRHIVRNENINVHDNNFRRVNIIERDDGTNNHRHIEPEPAQPRNPRFNNLNEIFRPRAAYVSDARLCLSELHDQLSSLIHTISRTPVLDLSRVRHLLENIRQQANLEPITYQRSEETIDPHLAQASIGNRITSLASQLHIQPSSSRIRNNIAVVEEDERSPLTNAYNEFLAFYSDFLMRYQLGG